MSELNTLGSRFKSLREESGLTQAQVSDYLGVDQSYVSRFEKNERQLGVEHLERLSYLYGCSLNELTTSDCYGKPLSFALRATAITPEDLETLAAINRIALNLRTMEALLRGEQA